MNFRGNAVHRGTSCSTPPAHTPCPVLHLAAASQALKRKLAARRAFVPWGGGKFVPLKLKAPLRDPLPEPEPAGAAAASAVAPAVVLPPGVEPLILWEPPAGAEGQPVRVDDMLTQVGRHLGASTCAPFLLMRWHGGHPARLAVAAGPLSPPPMARLLMFSPAEGCRALARLQCSAGACHRACSMRWLAP